MRKWLIEETGEVRQLRKGEVGWIGDLCKHGRKLLFWETDSPSCADYNVVTITEITEPDKWIDDWF